MPTNHFLEDSKEKSEVRTKLWTPIFDALLYKKSVQNLKYLCFPGERCHYVRYLVENNKLLIKNCVAVEEYPFKIPIIQEEFGKLGGITDPKEVHRGRMETLIEDDDFKNLFPFDILNLDFECPAFPADKIRESKVLAALETGLEQQFARKKDFSIIVTFKLYQELQRRLTNPNLRNRSDWLIQTYLRHHARVNQTLNSFLNQRPKGRNFKNWCSLYSIPLDINQLCNRRFKVELIDTPHTYIGGSAGYSTRMVSYAFRFIRVDNPPRNQSYYNNLRKNCAKQMIDLVYNTKWIKWDGTRIIYENIIDTM